MNFFSFFLLVSKVIYFSIAGDQSIHQTSRFADLLVDPAGRCYCES